MADEAMNKRLASIINDPSFIIKHPEERYLHLMDEIRKDPVAFLWFHRLTCQQFDELRDEIHPRLHGILSQLKVSTALCLSLALRYISRDDRIDVPQDVFGVDSSYVPFLLENVYAVIIDVLRPKVFTMLTDEDIKQVAQDFHEMWKFPHCIGAMEFRHIICQHYIDGRRVGAIGSVGFISDPFYRFSCFYIADPLKNAEPSSSRISLSQCNFHANIIMSRFPRTFYKQDSDDCYVTVGNQDSNLTRNNMRPYYFPIGDKPLAFNNHLNRAKRVVDDALGMLFYRWRIFTSPINITDITLERVVTCTIMLHNWLMTLDTGALIKTYAFQRCLFDRDEYNNLLPGLWETYSMTPSVRSFVYMNPSMTYEGQLRRNSIAHNFIALW